MDLPRTHRKPRGRRLAIVVAGVVLALGSAATLAHGNRPKAPEVNRSLVWTGRVERGPLVMSVKGAGMLVPEEMRWITVETSGRVEKIFLRPGAPTQADTALIQLENTDLRLQALQAEREVATAKADIIQLEHRLKANELAEKAAGVSLHGDLAEARRRASAYAQGEGQVVSLLDAQQMRERAADLEQRSALTDARVSLLEKATPEELAAQRIQIARREEVQRFRQAQVEGLTVRAGGAGILQDLSVELGQWVVPGTVLAKVVVSSRLKAELRISEAQAKDVAVGQPAKIDAHSGVVSGHVVRVAPTASQGTVKLEIALDDPLPQGARASQSIDGYVETARLPDVLQVARPVGVDPESDAVLFRVEKDSGRAVRVTTHMGRTSVDKIEIRAGASSGDELILSDTSRWANDPSIVLR